MDDEYEGLTEFDADPIVGPIAAAPLTKPTTTPPPPPPPLLLLPPPVPEPAATNNTKQNPDGKQRDARAIVGGGIGGGGCDMVVVGDTVDIRRFVERNRSNLSHVRRFIFYFPDGCDTSSLPTLDGNLTGRLVERVPMDKYLCFWSYVVLLHGQSICRGQRDVIGEAVVFQDAAASEPETEEIARVDVDLVYPTRKPITFTEYYEAVTLLHTMPSKKTWTTKTNVITSSAKQFKNKPQSFYERTLALHAAAGPTLDDYFRMIAPNLFSPFLPINVPIAE
jgi:hypothetical protein